MGSEIDTGFILQSTHCLLLQEEWFDWSVFHLRGTDGEEDSKLFTFLGGLELNTAV